MRFNRFKVHIVQSSIDMFGWLNLGVVELYWSKVQETKLREQKLGLL